MTLAPVSWLRSTLWSLRGLAAAAICVVGTAYFAREVSGHIPFDRWLLWSLLTLWGYSLYFAVACLLAGNALLRLILQDRDLPPVEWVLQSMTIGLVLFVVGMAIGGAACQFRPAFSIALPATMIAAGVVPAQRTWRRMKDWWCQLPRPPLLASIAYAVMAGWGVFCLAFVYLEALHPSAINFDAEWYHIPIAQDYAREGCVVPFPGEDHRAFPHLASIVYTWALLVPGIAQLPVRWMLILHLEFIFVLIRILGVAAAAQWLLGRDRTPAIWVTFFLFPSIFIYDQNIGGAADQAIALSAVPIMLALGRTVGAWDPRHAVVLGLALGCHLLAKYQAVYLGVGVVLVMALRWVFCFVWRLFERRFPLSGRPPPTWRRLLLAPAIVFLVAAAASSPHFVKNVAFYGNPVYPFALKAFPGSHPVQPEETYQRLGREKDSEFVAKGKGIERQLWVAETFLRASFDTRNRDLTKHRPYMGSLLTLLLPCILFVRSPRRLWFATGLFGIAFYVWANTNANDRYLLSFLGIGMGLTAALIVRVWELGWLARIAIVPLVGVQLAWGGDAMFTYGQKRLVAALKLFDGKPLAANSRPIQITKALPREARVLARNYKELLGLDRMVLSDIRGEQGYITYTGVRSPAQLWHQLREKGITHLLYPEGQRRPHRWNNTVLFGAVAHAAKGRRDVGGVVVVPLPEDPPPGAEPYLVLVRGISEYPDGIYRVEQLDVDDRAPATFRPRPVPEKALSAGNAVELVRRARAVAQGPRALPQDAALEVGKDFELVERLGRYTLYLRSGRARR